MSKWGEVDNAPRESTDDKFVEEFFNETIENAKINLKRDGHLIPIVFIVGPTREIGMIPVSFDSPQEKYRVYDAIGEACIRFRQTGKLSAVITINDARMAMAPINQSEEEYTKSFKPGSIANDKANKEAIIVSLTRVGHEPKTAIVAYHRDASEKVEKFEEPIILGEGGHTGAKMMMLPRWWE
jgi:hypothetical protein